MPLYPIGSLSLSDYSSPRLHTSPVHDTYLGVAAVYNIHHTIIRLVGHLAPSQKAAEGNTDPYLTPS